MSKTNSNNSLFSNSTMIHILAEVVIGCGIVYYFMSKNNTLSKFLNINQRKILELEAKVNQQDQMLRYALNTIEQQKMMIQKLINETRNPIIEVDRSDEFVNKPQQPSVQPAGQPVNENITHQNEHQHELHINEVHVNEVHVNEQNNEDKFETESNLDKELENELNELNNDEQNNDEQLSITGQDEDSDEDSDESDEN